MREIGIGTSNFEEIVSSNDLLIDKTLLIKDLLNDSTKVYLIPRPRRFGKTLNISMLKYFFERTEISNVHLFEGLKINQYPELLAKHQGQYPVIHLSFKDVKDSSWAEIKTKITEVISKEFERHEYLLKFLSDKNKKYFLEILNLDTQVDFSRSILYLSEYLYQVHNQKVILLIDEYDTPFNTAFGHGFFEEARNFVSSMYGAALKDNDFLYKAVVTGIYRISKESIFSGLNNLSVCSILSNKLVTHFGFTEPEMEEIYSEYAFSEAEKEEVKTWYNGYFWGTNTTIYNPWSIVNYIKEGRLAQPYWVNTSSNDIIKELISNSSVEAKQELEELLKGGSIEKPIIDQVVFDDLKHNESKYIWTFFLFSGYLNISSQFQDQDGAKFGKFEIPNKELRLIFKESILYWFAKAKIESKLEIILEALVKNDLNNFSYYFTDFIDKVMSYYDFADKEPERVYHALVLGMMVNLQSKYKITSNRESGYGRYDILLHPLNHNLPAYVFEFKKFHYKVESDIDATLANALAQIKEKKYASSLLQKGFTNIHLIAIAFQGKETKMLWEKV